VSSCKVFVLWPTPDRFISRISAVRCSMYFTDASSFSGIDTAISCKNNKFYALGFIIYMYRVGQKCKLLISSKFVNKTEQIGKREQIRTSTKKMKHCLIFHMKYFTSRLFYV